jgi:DNA polymerase III epsilon subunit-like protein
MEPNVQEKLSRIIAPGFPPNADWTKLPLAVIDFETTGLDPTVDRIVEYGIAFFHEGKFEHLVNGFMNPEVELTQEVIDVHGITNEMLVDKPTFEQAVAGIEKTLLGRVPVAYNADFDRDFILCEVSRVLRKEIIETAKKQQGILITPEIIEQALNPENFPPAFRQHVEWIDPLVWVRKLYKYEKGKKLTDMCRRLKIDIDQAHRAGADAKAAGELLLKIAPQINEPTYLGLIMKQKELAVQQQQEFEAWRQNHQDTKKGEKR